MPMMLERWNDDKMDALDAKVDRIDAKVDGIDARVDRIDLEVRELRQELREDRKGTKAGFENLHRTLVQTTVAVFTALVVGFTALFGAIATQF